MAGIIAAPAWAEAELAEVTQREPEVDETDATAWKYTPWKYTPWKYGKRDMEIDDEIEGTAWKYHPPWKYTPWRYANQAEGEVDTKDAHPAEQVE
ncbi:hypothetical protein N8T08_002939 [Aspergillus melleus]|uniref:Uncharacterized protein n=1 Tax=Aspergillus melleus TaxID=138277 RepID=A0ACC3B7W5_9EURO|nr:hypothetical protein N8T08_002939 [Aspergillus melleus]